MENAGQHIRIRLKDDTVIAPTPAERRAVINVVLSQAQSEKLVAFGLSDTRLLLTAVCSSRAGAQLARRIELALHHRLNLTSGFERAYLQPVMGGRHLYGRFNFVLEQHRRYGLKFDPHFEGTHLWDLLGLRCVGSYIATNVNQWLPRLDFRSLREYLGVNRLVEASGPLDWMIEATKAAMALSELQGSSRQVVEARRALVQVASGHFGSSVLAEALNVDRRTISRARSGEANQQIIKAIRLQLGFMAERSRRIAVNGPDDAPT